MLTKHPIRGRKSTACLVCGLGLLITGLPNPAKAGSYANLRDSDFDWDGWNDLAVGIANEDISLGGGISATEAGAVMLLWGTSDAELEGPKAGYLAGLHREVSGVAGSAGNNQKFGAALAVGDFDNDGAYDLAVGVPGGDSIDVVDAYSSPGEVQIFYGAADESFDLSRDFIFNCDTASVPCDPQTNSGFGSSLDSGDFNGDGYDDLAISIDWYDLPEGSDAGAVLIVYSGSLGVSPPVSTLIHQTSTHQGWDLEGSAESGDKFGQALAVGDFDCDGYDDIAVGAPAEAVGSIQFAGSVNVMYGGASGLQPQSSRANQLWHQDTSGVLGAAESQDSFGISLAAGNFNGENDSTPCVDLAIGVPGENVPYGGGTVGDAGAVNVLHGSSTSGLQAGDDFQFYQGDGVTEGTPQDSDRFGEILEAYHVPKTSAPACDFLAVGIRGEGNGSGPTGAGAVYLVPCLEGEGLDPDAADDEIVTQAHGDIADDQDHGSAGHEGDGFGRSLGVVDLNGNTLLIIGAPFEDFGSDEDVGKLWAVRLTNQLAESTEIEEAIEWAQSDVGWSDEPFDAACFDLTPSGS